MTSELGFQSVETGRQIRTGGGRKFPLTGTAFITIESHYGIEFTCVGPNLILAPLQAGTGNSEFLHFVDQGSALDAEFGGGAFGTADHPTNSFQRL
jgi:hypothetical protein